MRDKELENSTEEQRFYRCPGCGERVDTQELDAIRVHHDHILHPREDFYTPLLERHRATATSVMKMINPTSA